MDFWLGRPTVVVEQLLLGVAELLQGPTEEPRYDDTVRAATWQAVFDALVKMAAR
eukprot:CAMPEP_0176444258 /NCGR_PEP_ID=MMETSP0127-20121128/22951_1 /TAXON_ID=938130 /ORGANISM="Platyophrya macrostoma, Strain WH" /LENGTH=54 /DNA_ID=CAMNT_0017829723 /DNA_START=22 /DNA_END=182 /DNA_ORIENTATION=+